MESACKFKVFIVIYTWIFAVIV